MCVYKHFFWALCFFRKLEVPKKSHFSLDKYIFCKTRLNVLGISFEFAVVHCRAFLKSKFLSIA